jgi:hypothetical protein
MLLVTSIPLTLPFARDEIHIDSRTYTVDCTEEIIPDDEGEDIEYQVKSRSAVKVLIRIGNEPIPSAFSGPIPTKKKKKGRKQKGKIKAAEDVLMNAERGNDQEDLGQAVIDEELEEGEDEDEDEGVFVYKEGSQE